MPCAHTREVEALQHCAAPFRQPITVSTWDIFSTVPALQPCARAFVLSQFAHSELLSWRSGHRLTPLPRRGFALKVLGATLFHVHLCVYCLVSPTGVLPECLDSLVVASVFVILTAATAEVHELLADDGRDDLAEHELDRNIFLLQPILSACGNAGGARRKFGERTCRRVLRCLARSGAGVAHFERACLCPSFQILL